MVWPSDVTNVANSNRVYEDILHAREEAGMPGVVESIHCGLAFHVRDLVGPKHIEELEGEYAAEAVRCLQAQKVWVMGDVFLNITSKERLSITSFNVWCRLPGCDNEWTDSDAPPGTLAHPTTTCPLMLHPHFVAALLNDVYGIQA
jgi:selenocysteine lyase/cysteine desulfurase